MAIQTKARQQTVGREAEPAQRLERGVALGRNGETIRRISTTGTDPYRIPDMLKEQYRSEGFELQWNVASVLGKDGKDSPDMLNIQKMHNFGWRPVPADRHPGVWLPEGTKGDITIGGLRLEECPTKLVLEARAEERREAADQINGSRESFGYAPTAKGFEGAETSNSPHVKRNTFVRREMIRDVDTPRPNYEVSLDD